MRRAVYALIALVCMSAPSIARAQTSPPAAADGTIEGRVTDSGGASLAGASVTATGPVTRTATSMANGSFSLTVPAGIYSITVSRAGYSPTIQTDYVVLSDTRNTVRISLTAATLTSLREIGRATVVSSRSAFNAGPASVQTISSQTFQDQGQFQVQRILDQTPGIVVDHPGTNATNASLGAITFPSIRGGLGFETASLIDGHPIAVQTFGDYVTSFLVADTLQSIEVIKGPGAAAPEVNYAINGTVNFRTLDPTREPHGYVKQVFDSYGGASSVVRFTDSFLRDGKLGVALVYAIEGSPGALVNNNNNVTLGSSTLLNGLTQTGFTTTAPSNASSNGIQNNPFYANSTLVACCLPVNQNYNTRAELAKLRYKFSDATSFLVSYLGSQTYTDQNGNHVYNYVTNFAPGATYGGSIAPGRVSTWQSVFFPANEWENNNEPIFQGELHSTFKGDSITARYYTASISRLQYNSLNDPTASYTGPLNLFGTATTCPKPGEIYNSTAKKCGPASGPFTDAPAVQTYNGQQTGITIPGAYFRSTEHDILHGGSLEYDHFFGQSGNVLSGAFDLTSSTTDSFSYSPTLSISIPAGSREQFITGLLRYIGNLTPELNATVSGYYNTYQFHTSQNNGLSFGTSYAHRFDGRLGLAYRYNPNVSLRAAAGSAISPPYLALFSVAPSPPILSQDKTAATNRIPNANIIPETSFGYDVGGDFRVSNDGATVVSTDLYLNNVFNQFLTATIANGTTTLCSDTSLPPPCKAGVQTITVPLYSSQNQNLGRGRYEGIELSVRRDPAIGFGFVAQGALMKSFPIVNNPCFYASAVKAGVLNCSVPATNLGVINGSNYYTNGTSGSPGSFNSVNNHSEPYSQGYGEVHYRTPKNGYLMFGAQYYGPNNSLNVPAFWSTNASLRLAFPEQVFAQASVQNLNEQYRAPWISPFGGVPVPLQNGKLGLTNANTLGPAYFTFTIGKTL